jgi:hypothetical protein
VEAKRQSQLGVRPSCNLPPRALRGSGIGLGCAGSHLVASCMTSRGP